MITFPCHTGTAPVHDLAPHERDEHRAEADRQPMVTFLPHPDGGRRGCLLVFPGGGYHRHAPHEAEPVAQAFHRFGLHGAVLRYRVFPHRAPTPLVDARAALARLAERDDVDEHRIALCGFSAGGHCAGSLATDTAEGHRPAAAILGYPVSTLHDPHCHRGSRQALLGPDANAHAIRAWSLEDRLEASCPPLFCWHTASDTAVPVSGVLPLLATAQAKRVPCSLHVFPFGSHGVGLIDDERMATEAPGTELGRAWVDLAGAWLVALGVAPG